MDKKFWMTNDGARLTRSVFASLLSGQRLDHLPLPEHEGRIDLRAISIPPLEVLQDMARRGDIPETRVKKPRLQNMPLERIDFGGADLSGIRFFNIQIRDCCFDNVTFRDLKIWQTTIRESTFQSARMADTNIGTWNKGKGNEYTDVDFRKANLSRAICPAASFKNVDFSGARIVDVDFGASSFTSCTFSGELRRVIFWDRPMTSDKTSKNPMMDVDFSDAELHDVEFRGLRLDRVTLPTGGNHVIVNNYLCVLKKAVERLKGSNAFGAVLAHELHWSHPLRTQGVWHRDELGENDDERNEISNLLREIDMDCSHTGPT